MRPVDFDIYDTATGGLLVRAEAFTAREVPKDGFGQAHEGRGRPGPVSTAAPGPTEKGARTPFQPAAVGGPELLRPDEGTTVLRQLLEHAQPPVVLVDLVARPLEVPGIPWVGEAPDAPGKEPADRVAPTAVQMPAHPSTTDTTASAVPPAGTAGPERPDTIEDEVTNVLRELWHDALGVAAPDLDDDFFDLGGDSLGAVQLAARISRQFGIELGAGAIFDSSTLRALGAEVRGSWMDRHA
jgi:acyl carrier protein